MRPVDDNEFVRLFTPRRVAAFCIAYPTVFFLVGLKDGLSTAVDYLIAGLGPMLALVLFAWYFHASKRASDEYRTRTGRNPGA